MSRGAGHLPGARPRFPVPRVTGRVGRTAARAVRASGGHPARWPNRPRRGAPAGGFPRAGTGDGAALPGAGPVGSRAPCAGVNSAGCPASAGDGVGTPSAAPCRRRRRWRDLPPVPGRTAAATLSAARAATGFPHPSASPVGLGVGRGRRPGAGPRRRPVGTAYAPPGGVFDRRRAAVCARDHRTGAARFGADAASLRCGVSRGRVGRAEGEGAGNECRRTCS